MTNIWEKKSFPFDLKSVSTKMIVIKKEEKKNFLIYRVKIWQTCNNIYSYIVIEIWKKNFWTISITIF